MFDPAAGDRADVAGVGAVWFDAFASNVDRTARNPNLLCWHKALYFIDHGAGLYFHHDWKDTARESRRAFPATAITSVTMGGGHCGGDRALCARLNRRRVRRVLDRSPTPGCA